MIEILRNLARRKLRSILTISGIVIGIFAFTTMGAMSEHFNALLNGGIQYSSSSVSVGPPAQQQGAVLPLTTADAIARVSGVSAVYPRYVLDAAPGGTPSFGAPDMIVYQSPEAAARSALKMSVSQGRDLANGARGEVVLGTSMANEFKKGVGSTIDLPRKPKDAPADFVTHTFTVVGIMGRTGTGPDTMAFVSLADARMLLAETLPPAVRQAVDVNTVAMGFTVYAKPGSSLSQLDALAAAINSQVPGVKADKPSDLVNSFKSFSTTFTAITTGSALLALLIGGLSVVNTMIMAVSERVREIGLKKALGAHTGRLLAEYLLEAATIGAIGGIAGYALGLLVTSVINYLGRASNLDLFLVTPNLTLLAIGFAIGLATLAGIAPALRAARLEPVSALRSTN
jgi:putative ABC transport system permease protein